MFSFTRALVGSTSAIAVSAIFLATPAIAQERAYAFSIPKQDLRASLRSFARVTKQQITFDGAAIRGKQAPALVGDFTARAGLQKLLNGTGLSASWGKSGVIVIRKVGPVLAVAPTQLAQPADEQDPAPAAGPAEASADDAAAPGGGGEILVTGSRIARQVQTDSPVPVVGIGVEDIQSSGSTQLSEILLDYPAVTVDSNAVNTVNNINAAGLSTISLRDLGADRTLTLIDGRRTVTNRFTRNTVSLSTIPTMFVQKVEIITGGASAIYGSDAIAGVVNIITRKNYDGLKIGGRAGISEQGDSARYNVDALFGTKFFDDRASLVLGASYEREDGLFARDREQSRRTISYSTSQDSNPLNQGDLGINLNSNSSSPPSGRFGSSSTPLAGRPTVRAGYFVYDDNGALYQTANQALYGYDTRRDVQLSIPRDSYLGAGRFTFELGSDIEFFANGQYSRIDTTANRGFDSVTSSETFGIADAFTLGNIPRSNPFIPAVIRSTITSSSGIPFSRRFMELGVYGTDNTRETYRGWTGFNGKLGGNWIWEVSYGYGRFHQGQVRTNAINIQNLKFALNAEFDPAAPGDLSRVRCVDATARANGCVPINLFGAGSVTPAAADYIRANMATDALVTQHTFQGFISGELFQLPAGPLSVALGAEYRRDWQRSITDEVTRQGLGSASFIAEYEGNIKAKEAFAEIGVPILKDTPFFHELTFDAAARIGDYNIENVGSIFSWRVGGGWAPVEGLRFRGQFARSQRAPTITNLYSPLRDDADDVDDPCDGVTNASVGTVAVNCRSIAAIQQQINTSGSFQQATTDIKGPTLGNRFLKEETADTLTLGAVFTPRFVPGISLTVDYFKIEVEDAINSLSADQLVNECYGNDGGIVGNPFCAFITRDGTGQLTQIVNQELNLDRIVRSGYDIGLDYRFNAPTFLSDRGRFDLRLHYSRLLDYYTDFEGMAGLTRTDNAGEIGSWKHSGQAQLGYRQGGLSLRWKARYLGKAVDSNIRLANALAAGSNPPFLYVGDRIKHDFYISQDIEDDQGPDLRVYAGVNNAFNSASPFLPSGTTSGGTTNVSGAYDVVGRYFYVGFEAKF